MYGPSMPPPADKINAEMTFLTSSNHEETKQHENPPVCHFCNALLVENDETNDLRTRYVNICSDLTRELCSRVDAIQKAIPEGEIASKEEKQRVGRVNAEIWERLTQLREASTIALEATSLNSSYRPPASSVHTLQTEAA